MRRNAGSCDAVRGDSADAAVRSREPVSTDSWTDPDARGQGLFGLSLNLMGWHAKQAGHQCLWGSVAHLEPCLPARNQEGRTRARWKV